MQHLKCRLLPKQAGIADIAGSRALAVVMEIAMSMGIKTKPQSANSTRFTSTLLMLESLQQLKPALVALATTRRAEVIQSKEVLDALKSMEFWGKVDMFVALLTPFAQSIMAIQANSTTLADVTWYRLYNAVAIRSQLPKMPEGKFLSLSADVHGFELP